MYALYETQNIVFMNQKAQRQALVDTFLHSIYPYDAKVLITFHYEEGTQTITFGKAAEAVSEGNGPSKP